MSFNCFEHGPIQKKAARARIPIAAKRLRVGNQAMGVGGLESQREPISAWSRAAARKLAANMPAARPSQMSRLTRPRVIRYRFGRICGKSKGRAEGSARE